MCREFFCMAQHKKQSQLGCGWFRNPDSIRPPICLFSPDRAWQQICHSSIRPVHSAVYKSQAKMPLDAKDEFRQSLACASKARSKACRSSVWSPVACGCSTRAQAEARAAPMARSLLPRLRHLHPLGTVRAASRNGTSNVPRCQDQLHSKSCVPENCHFQEVPHHAFFTKVEICL